MGKKGRIIISLCMSAQSPILFFFCRKDTIMKRLVCFFLVPLFFFMIETASKADSNTDGFILLPAGEFQMGSPDHERQRNADEVRHTVHLSSFFVDPYEVTQADYEAVMKENPSKHKGKKLPVENVTWFDAIRFCNALSQSRGLEPAYSIEGETVTWNRKANGYRLLTEAEWEYAARGGKNTVFNVGNQVNSETVNFEATYPYLIEENYVTQHDPSVVPSYNRGETIKGDALPPNAFGLHHMHGNVSEWVFDYYGPYDTQTTTNPAGPSRGALRVNRGGSFNDFGKHLRCAYRSATNPIDPDPNLGFRICRNAEPQNDVVRTEAPARIAVPEAPRVLVAYYSYSGNTRRAAKMISKKLNAPLFEIAMKSPYRGNIYDVSQKDLNRGFRPPLKENTSIADYDVIVLGYPTWWATMPMPVLSFLESHDLNGKIILPFSSHGGTIFGDSVSDLAKCAKGAYVGIGFEFHYSGGSKLDERITQWLRQSALLK